jgi:hypothetical protein
MLRKRKFHFIIGVIIFSLVFLMLMAAPAGAASTMSQGFLSAKPVKNGELVSTNNNPGVIQQATTTNAENLVGVVAQGDESLLTVTTTANEIQVATTGIADALVSTVNGEVKVGDRITATPIEGVGGKAVTSGRVVGVAQASVDAKTPGASKTKVKSKGGQQKDIYVAKIPILVSLSYFSIGEAEKSLVPSFLQKLANTVASKQVSQLPIAISGIILLVTLMAASVITFTATRSAIISIGRNPLSRGSVVGGLIQVMFLVIGIIVAGMGSIFLVLRLV